jgi:PAS domain S-box-containing protein
MVEYACLRRVLTEQKARLFPKKSPHSAFIHTVYNSLLASCFKEAEICDFAAWVAKHPIASAEGRHGLLRALDDFELSVLSKIKSSCDTITGDEWLFLCRFFCETRKAIGNSLLPADRPATQKSSNVLEQTGSAQLFDEVMHQILDPSIGPDAVLKKICEGALKLTAAEAVTIYTIDRNANAFLLKQFLVGPVYLDLQQKKLPEVMATFASIPRHPSAAHGLFHVALSERRPVFSGDISNDPRVHLPQILKQWGINSLLVLPMQDSDKELGFMAAVPSPGLSFVPAEIENLTLFADMAALAWRNAELYDELRKSEQKYRDLIDNAIDIIFILDKEGRFLSGNRQAEHMSGYTAATLQSHHFWEIVVPEDVPAAKAKFFQGLKGGTDIASIRIKSADGRILLAKINSSVIEEDGDVKGLMCIARDATEEAERELEFKQLHESVVETNRKLEDSMAKLKSAQAKLIQTEKLSAMGDLISGIAHEINNPLTGIMGYSQLLLEETMDDKYRKNLEKINQSALRCKQIIQNLLRFSRNHQQQKQNVDIHAVMNSVFELKRYQLQLDRIALELEFDEGVPPVVGDYYQIQQVILNVINNAHQALLSQTDSRLIKVKTATDLVSRQLRISIADNGSGIKQDLLPKIFDPFFTTKETGAGTGLGLSVAYGIMKEHGGQISVQSIPMEGATFYLDFPIPDSVVSGKGKGEKPHKPLEKSRILVIDDEEVILDLLTDILTQMDRHVERAHNGAEALEKINTAMFDVIICDLKMPGMDGKTFYRKVKESSPELARKIIFSTGDTLSEDFRTFCAEIDRKVVEKPFLLEDLKKAIEALERDQLQRQPE